MWTVNQLASGRQDTFFKGIHVKLKKNTYKLIKPRANITHVPRGKAK